MLLTCFPVALWLLRYKWPVKMISLSSTFAMQLSICHEMINSSSQVIDWTCSRGWCELLHSVANVSEVWSCRNLWLWVVSTMAQLEELYCIFVFLYECVCLHCWAVYLHLYVCACVCVCVSWRERGSATWAPIIGLIVQFYCSIFKPGTLCVQLWRNHIVMHWSSTCARRLKCNGKN